MLADCFCVVFLDSVEGCLDQRDGVVVRRSMFDFCLAVSGLRMDSKERSRDSGFGEGLQQVRWSMMSLTTLLDDCVLYLKKDE